MVSAPPRAGRRWSSVGAAVWLCWADAKPRNAENVKASRRLIVRMLPLHHQFCGGSLHFLPGLGVHGFGAAAGRQKVVFGGSGGLALLGRRKTQECGERQGQQAVDRAHATAPPPVLRWLPSLSSGTRSTWFRRRRGPAEGGLRWERRFGSAGQTQNPGMRRTSRPAGG